MNNYEIIDEYGYKNYDYLNDLLEYACKKLKLKNVYFEIIFINNDKIHQINKEYRNIDRPTDVISFAFNDNGNLTGPINMLGEIYVSIDRMKEQAIDYNHSEKRELSFLCIHGLLHLLGYDHTLGEKEEKEMFDLQKEILNEKGIIN